MLGNILLRCGLMSQMRETIRPSGLITISARFKPKRKTFDHSDYKATETDVGQLKPDLHEPAYLADLKPKIGYYSLLDVQLKGYDFVVLERYQSYLHKTMKRLEFNVVKTWSAPYQELKLENLAQFSSGVETVQSIKIYERNIQIKYALVTKLPILIDLIHTTSPPGVSFSIDRHTKEADNKLYFRDSVLEKYEEELRELKETPLIGAV